MMGIETKLCQFQMHSFNYSLTFLFVSVADKAIIVVL